MGNTESSPGGADRGFPGSALFDSIQACGSLQDTVDEDESPSKKSTGINKFLNQAETLCAQSPSSEAGFGKSKFDDEYEDFRKGASEDDDDEEDETRNNGNDRKENHYTPTSPVNQTSAMFARALVSEVTDNPKTMTPAAMADREKRLIKAQERARLAGQKDGDTSRPVGAPGGIGQPSVLGSIAHALTGTTDPLRSAAAHASSSEGKASVLPPNSMSENRAQVDSNTPEAVPGKHTITIGLSLSRRSSVGHPDTVTRQTAFDFNELQDREYKYVSSTDSSGWRAGGGERGGPLNPNMDADGLEQDGPEFGGSSNIHMKPLGPGVAPGTPTGGAQNHKMASPDTVHISIIHIDAESPQAVDAIIAALARGEVFIPHMAIMPESLSVDGVSPPDLVVRFGTERNEDLPPDDWPNWCLEFMHNQLYEYFQGMGARWMKRPFSITLAKKVRWKTVKHMNRYFAHAERVIDAWREKGPQYLDPQLAYIEGGATPEEVARPHGIYLLRNGVPTNYFAPNFDPPYTTKMTRSLLLNVLGKSWDKKRREWTSEPITPAMLVTAMCGCGDNSAGGFIANEVTLANKIDTSSIPEGAIIRSDTPKRPPTKQQRSPQQPQQQPPQQHQQQQQTQPPQTPSADTDIASEVYNGEPISSPVKPHQQPQQQKLSLEKLSLEEQPRKLADAAPSREDDENRSLDDTSSSESSSFSRTSFKQMDEELELHLSSSTGTEASASKQPSKVLSPKYGGAPTPEQIRSPRSALEENEGKEEDEIGDVINEALEAGAPSDVVPPSVTGTNSTIMHMNLSADRFMNREMERRTDLDEKKEDEVALVSDEDWLDEMVSTKAGDYTYVLFG
jgi:hypothetical protein